MYDKITAWVTMHIIIPIGAVRMYARTLNEEVKGQ